MKRFLFTAAIVLISAPVFADVGVSVNVGQPGFYGRIDIGNFPQPQVVYSQPVLIQRPPVYVEAEPIYLRVPPSHRGNWRKYCSRYNACGQPVYFVRDDWYHREYAPRYREEHRERHDDERERGHDRDHGRGHGDDRGDDHGRGRHD
jgi:hypothetical protein